jgi:hypothetical protein
MFNVKFLKYAGFLFLFALLIPQPAAAQVDLAGMWAPMMHEDQPERAPGPEVGDYLGLPINDAARQRATTWDASLLTLPEHQCKPHPSTYGFRGVGNLRITNEVDNATEQVKAIHTHIQWQEQERTIWMDGRPHPPEFAAHTWQGFSTGRYENGILVVRTTHLKQGWIRRNGIAISDRATMEDRFYRHGQYLTHVSIITDPVYLTEPIVRSNQFQLVTNPNLQPYPCLPAVEVPRAKGEVPHHLPGTSGYIEEFAKRHNLPVEAVRGGAETALPEFMRNRQPAPAQPARSGQSQ